MNPLTQTCLAAALLLPVPPTPVPDPRAALLVPQLASDDFATRQRAETMLRRMGADADDALEAGRRHPDVAVRAVCWQLQSERCRLPLPTYHGAYPYLDSVPCDFPDRVRLIQLYRERADAEVTDLLGPGRDHAAMMLYLHDLRTWGVPDRVLWRIWTEAFLNEADGLWDSAPTGPPDWKAARWRPYRRTPEGKR